MWNQGWTERWQNRALVDRHGEKIGTIAEVYVEAGAGHPEWVLVHMGLFGTRETFVPVSRARTYDGAVRVPYPKSFVRDAPNIGNAERSEHLAALCEYYNLSNARVIDAIAADRPDRAVEDNPVVIDIHARTWRRPPRGPDLD
jgi:hypothetical protein